MLGKKKFEPKLMYTVSLEDLVPEDNFYRKLNRLLDLGFVYQRCKNLYGKTGKPSVDSVVFIKLNLFGYFENIEGDRELIRKASDSLSARYYLGYDIDEELPWHSTISRTRALIKEELYEEIFNEVLKKCVEAGLVSGDHQSIDSTLVKANASLESLEKKRPELRLTEYIKKTIDENKTDDKAENQSDEKTTKEKDDDEIVKPKTEIKEMKNLAEGKKTKRSNKYYISKTDPDSRIAKKPGKKTDLYYTTHYSVDSKNKVITDVVTTHSDITDSDTMMEVVDRATERLENCGLKIHSVAADKRYCSGENLRDLEQRGIFPYIPIQKHPNTTGGISKEEFKYDKEKDEYICPNNKTLRYRYTTKRRAKTYSCSLKDCKDCPIKVSCSPGKKARKVQHSIYLDEYDRLEKRLRTPLGKRAMILRKTGPEPLFGEAKLYHGLNKFMTKGKDKAQKNSFMIATVQNLKRLIKSINHKKIKVKSVSILDNIISGFSYNIYKLNYYISSCLNEFIKIGLVV
jgi:transposase